MSSVTETLGGGVLTLTAPIVADMPQLQDVVVRHLVRFAFREEIAVEWTDAEGL